MIQNRTNDARRAVRSGAVHARYHAHHDVVGNFGMFAVWPLLGALVLVIEGFGDDRGWRAIFFFTVGVTLAITAIGVWRFDNRARLIGGVISIATGTLGTAGTVSSAVAGRPLIMCLWNGFYAAWLLFTGLLLLLPRTRSLFERARDARALAQQTQAEADVSR